MNNDLENFKEEVCYEVIVKKTVTSIKSDDTAYEQIGIYQEDGKYNKKGDPKYAYVTIPPHVVSTTVEVFKQISNNISVIDLIVAANSIRLERLT